MILLTRLFKEIFFKFPLIFFILFSSIFFQALLNSSTVVAMTPLVDFLMGNNNQSFITNFFNNLFTSIGSNTNLSLVHILIFIGVVFFFAGIFGIVTQYIILVVQYKVLNYLLSSTLKLFLTAKYSFFIELNIGKIVNSLHNEVSKVAQSFAGISRFMANLVQGIVLLIVPFTLSPYLTSIFIIFCLIFLAPLYFAKSFSYKFGKQNTSTANIMISYLHETLISAKIIQSFGLQDKTISNYKNYIKDHSNSTIRFQTLNRGIYLILIPLGTIAALFTLYVATKQNMLLAEMAMVFFAFSRLLPVVGILIQERSTLEGFVPAYEQLLELRSKAYKLQEDYSGKKFEKLKNKIEISNLNYTYPGREKTLDNINLEIIKGQTIALVGKSGSGKTTIVDILLGLFPYSEGKIKIDGYDFKDININSFRSKVGYVPQESQMLNMSIKENLKWSNDKLTNDDLIEICDLSNCLAFINDCKYGFDTIIGDRGIRLSGGQRQRLALARAIAKKPSILILDEATSNLDSESEILIQNSIKRLSKNMTIIIISHRISTIINANKIYVIDKGKIVDQGIYKDLVNKKHSIFSDLVKEQII